MTVRRMDHTGIVVDDMEAAISFFTDLGLELEGTATVEGDWVGRVIGLDRVRAAIAMLRTPDGQGRVELSTFQAPAAEGTGGAPSNTRGLRHIAFVVDDIDAVLERLGARGTRLVGEVMRYGDSYRLGYVRGPEGILVELAEQVG